MYELKRRPQSLSHSAFRKFESDPEEYFLQYLAANRPARQAQPNYMAIGSAFDAYEKAELHAALFGAGSNPEFEFQTIFEQQVEPHNRDWAIKAGKHVQEAYKFSGAHDDLLGLLHKSIESPQFEFGVEKEIDGVPLNGKPDCRFVLPGDDGRKVHVILDWKVKGFCSKHATSPSKGYALCRDGYEAAKPSRSHGKEHNQYLAYNHHGLIINTSYLEASKPEYADQTTMYGWLLGEEVGDEEVVMGIDEIVAKPAEPWPMLRVANHRARVSKGYQLELMRRLQRCWKAITTGHIFPDMTVEESDARCEILENMAAGLKSAGEEDEYFNEVTHTVTVLSNYGDPIGFIALRGVEDAAEIRKVAIKSRYRKQQLSYQLMESAILFARQKRFNSIFIIIPEAMIETVGPWLAKFNFTAKKPIIRDAFHAYGKPENGVKFVCRL
ncbi:unnamed protein product [Cladocopium goreaui]|uniref:PD-(D/E)XK endonuclease-like domain-containing protein n=1 Tax=Cladocopium goreaui TaxID=2562237 RepID=A0A9P1FER4_9DINO|nr:unnamed protein product [Cladocopium goreaui]